MNKKNIEYINKLAESLKLKFEESGSEDIRIYQAGFNTSIDVFRNLLLDHFQIED